MRASDAFANTPWPHEMIITIENSSDSLWGLLWVREAWGLEPTGDVPPPLENSPEPLGIAHDRAAWEQAWSELWENCLGHEAQGRDPRLFNQLQSTENGSAERAQLLAELVGPDWRAGFGQSALDNSFAEWQQARHEEVHEANTTPLDDSPERLSLDALIAAWEAGLTKVITIPCVGEYTRFVGTSALLVTEITRQEPAQYAIALSAFRKHANGENQ
jgi:hypothetical protein